MSMRSFKSACKLFHETVNTFTSYELFDYNQFIRYTIIVSMLVLSRNEIKDLIINGAEIFSNLRCDKYLKRFVLSLYECQYEEFFLNLAEVEQELKRDLFLNAHYRYYVREMKIKAYSQLLKSYRSLSLEYMAETFGVTAPYIEEDVAKFITTGRLNCKIDKVAGIVVTNRTNERGAQFLEVVRKGDILLNRVQKLSRVINI